MELEETKTGFASMIEAYKTGGPFMHIITFMALLILVVAGLKIYKMIVAKKFDQKLLGLIIMGGAFAAALGVLSQIIGIVGALEAIRVASDISPQLVMGGAIVSFYSTIWGFMVFLFSLLVYFILKEIVKAKLPESN